jgi:3',5'-cyclic AMP phosphodiesterase CpdA/tetratricopeptide (TPR) repeat protein
MKTMCILHLSDLHISESEDPSSVRLRESLLDDISKMISKHSLKIDAIAMTGDSVDKGGNETSYQIAENYYHQLIDKMGLPQENFLIIPGNHDIPRRDAISHLVKNNKSEFQDENKFSEHWETLETRFKNFDKLVRNLNGKDNYRTSGNYGGDIRIINTPNGTIKCYLLNSAWACIGNTDYGNILVGRAQLEKLKRNRDSTTNADLTIGLLHHPLDWLDNNDKSYVINFLTDQKCLPIDVLLHGHIHDAVIESYSNPDRKVNSLVTGIGYPDRINEGYSNTKVSNCRYSIYKFDITNGSVDIILRKSNANGEFFADTGLYRAASETGTLTLQYKDQERFVSVALADKIIDRKLEVDIVPSVPEWIGRNRELSILEERNLSVIAITGIWGQGKTALASEFLRRYTKGENAKYEVGIWVDCRELDHTLHYKLIETLEILSGGQESSVLYKDEKITDTVKRLIKHLKERKYLIVFDNLDAYVKAENEGPTEEFRPIFEALLNVEHQSLVIITCRPPLIHSTNAFHQLQLSGLGKEYAVDYFSKRNIQISKDNSKEYCEKIFELTKGHMWWLGLIAGQVNSGQDTLKKCVEKFKMGNVPFREQIQVYFKNIWRNLSKLKKNIIRYLVESHRPLSQDEINLALLDYNPSNVIRELTKLNRLGLVDLHESKIESNSVTCYQVHPLAKEFIHETYSIIDQVKYVQRILCIHMSKKDVDLLFNDISNLNEGLHISAKNLVDSIETCLNSRYIEKALNLLELYGDLLQDGGYHHEYRYLSCRTLDSINWVDHKITSSRGIRLLRNILQQLSYEVDLYKCNYYLKKFESLVEVNSASYLNYLSIATDILWRTGDYETSIELSNQYEKLAEKLVTTIGIADVKHSRALALRDIGKYEEALSLFDELQKESIDSDTVNEAIYQGNRARCLLKLNRYDLAEVHLKKSILFLIKDVSYLSTSNMGFAYLWLAEAFFEQKKYKQSKAFLILAQNIWTEYAPGLLDKVHHVKDRYNLLEEWNNTEVSFDEAKKIEHDFLL